MATVAVAFLFGVFPPCAFADVLYWMVGDSETVYAAGGSASTVYSLLSVVPDDDYNWPAARVRATSPDGSTTYLGIYFITDEGTWVEPGDFGVYWGDNGAGDIGCGVPTGVQSPVDNMMECLFAMELGHAQWDDDAGAGIWTLLAESDTVAYFDLTPYMYKRFDINPPTAGIWNPSAFYAVPEPSEETLLLFGLALVLLMDGRRLRRASR